MRRMLRRTLGGCEKEKGGTFDVGEKNWKILLMSSRSDGVKVVQKEWRSFANSSLRFIS